MEKMFLLKTEIHQFTSVREFFESQKLTKSDSIITNRFMAEGKLKGYIKNASVIFQEEYGNGEPTDQMVMAIKKDMPKDVLRIFAIGGGTVIDIAKFLVLESEGSIDEMIMKEKEYHKTRELIVIPTTCGTGSEVTNVAIAELMSRKTKKGLADDALYPDKAVLIPELVESLPYKFFATSSIDALVHAVESYLSPKASEYSKMFSCKAISMILKGYQVVVQKGKDQWNQLADQFLMASNFAGIAFGNAGCAAVHAMSYPLGGTYHIPHGEANQLMFEAVLRMYEKKDPHGHLEDLKEVLANELCVEKEKSLEALYELMDQILVRKSLCTYGIKKEELPVFAESVLEGQQRLLNNNYVELSYDDMMQIYHSVFDK